MVRDSLFPTASNAKPPPCLAPLQEVMLRDSFHAPREGYHVEQVEIVLARDFPPARITAAWEETVTVSEALRTTFDFKNGIPTGFHTALVFPAMEVSAELPASWEDWRESDRCRPLLFPEVVPWRIVYWPHKRKLVWTFHHVLLDGRSITRILRGFLARLAGNSAEALPLSRWQAPSAESVAIAAGIFHESARLLGVADFKIRDHPSCPRPAVRRLGNEFAKSLHARATEIETTAATLVIWAWGQAMAEFSGADAVLIEQVRAGAPQPGTAGFTMNLLPLVVRRSGIEALPDFHRDLLALRRIESVSFNDFAADIYPDVDAPGTSMIMVEHGTLQHAVGESELTESIVLHERKGESLMATAHLLPDLRLEVEGPKRHDLLAAWIEQLERGIDPT
ncbi:MAG: hypothetical protein ABIS50_10395 [Luteolibacter sp.]|uniref:hypothetical protein n=1 Tax=Luteolibacter sp. TaxID=1962973 RepID=UPI003266A1B1